MIFGAKIQIRDIFELGKVNFGFLARKFKSSETFLKFLNTLKQVLSHLFILTFKRKFSFFQVILSEVCLWSE